MNETTLTLNNMIIPECIGARIRLCSRIVTAFYEKELRNSDLRISQFALLNRIKENGPITAKHIGKSFVIEKSSLSRDLARLREAGWIEEVQGEDKRERLLTITPSGLEEFEKAKPSWEAAHKKMAEIFGPEGTEAVRLITKILISMQLP
jgi:DNA-binding MarR family transcriptional regulator